MARKNEQTAAPQSSQRAIDDAAYFLGRSGGNRPHVGRVNPGRQSDTSELRTKSDL